jgi:hypothetical protein
LSTATVAPSKEKEYWKMFRMGSTKNKEQLKLKGSVKKFAVNVSCPYEAHSTPPFQAGLVW